LYPGTGRYIRPSSDTGASQIGRPTMSERLYHLEEPVWSRQAWEGEKAYAAFLMYRDMGKDRTIDKVGVQLRGERPKGRRGAHARLWMWSSNHRWTERVRAWDNEVRRVADEKNAREWAEWEADLGRKRLEAKRKDMELATLLRDRVKELHDKVPIQRLRKAQDGKTVYIEPLRVTQKDLAVMSKFASDLEARALEVEQKESGAPPTASIVEVNVRVPEAALLPPPDPDDEAPWRGSLGPDDEDA
jgi:hypothetical protein